VSWSTDLPRAAASSAVTGAALCVGFSVKLRAMVTVRTASGMRAKVM
jgi:hypothetical protein